MLCAVYAVLHLKTTRNSVARDCCGVRDRIDKVSVVQLNNKNRCQQIDIDVKSVWKRREGRSVRTHLDPFGDVLKKGHVPNTGNKRECIKELMRVKEINRIHQERSDRGSWSLSILLQDRKIPENGVKPE